MHSVFATLMALLFLIGSTMAGYNCKCQDSNGQYNGASAYCCSLDQWYNLGTYFHSDQHNQCSNSGGGLDSGAFANCCRGQGVSSDPYTGAFCWQ